MRWNLDKDLYAEAIEKNISYLKFLLEHHEKDYGDHLRRETRRGKNSKPQRCINFDNFATL